ncbi:two-component system phosphate regulon response regulator PhoB [Sphaerotilus sulfidivorans]|jgi:two-component system phosphate regulon response regulator PhoB|uniref:Phosphate regulon transcriptional regulatory protein PhoB n=1 Tax=Sphaerotilus sulfidivorans TaxID=639200 RepID=A0A5C1Q0S2_9BURK|nr:MULTISPECIES: phosphate regulon transcriptional regulator PhoB [Sphaerotilus]NZD45764.1 phosphate regulon transcriptional regulator PhoB [Sphaerotilus sulfidivorans]QEN01088.1 phosphate regulon transcriptional regulatory protein PhoB [Sphaerotilus sulfidivorans]GIX50814.1 DNA-binding response regulator [Sphaerotilus natans]GKQ58226.1 DNA-binding response regulator [Sphaerotilus sp. FB-3]
MGRILVVEDEAAIAELLSMNLRFEGHEVRIAATSDEAVQAVRDSLPDLVVLDWMLPGEPGVALARRWRADARTRDLPIIMLTARSDERDLVQGLDAGADDYLAKPFSTTELMARIRSVLRRRLPEALESAVEIGVLRLDPVTRRVRAGQTEVALGPTEFRLLRFLMTYPERVHGRPQLLDRVWGDHVFIEERTVDVHIKRLRAALQPVGCADMIETVRGAGYRLTSSVPGTAGGLAA